MAATYPRILWDSHFYNLREHVWASSEDTGYAVENICDWRDALLWKPEWSDSLISNGDMLLWAGGAAAAPDSWTLSGAGASVARDSTNYYTNDGPYGAALTRAGTDCRLLQDVTSPTNYQNLKLTAGCWVKATVANRGMIQIGSDGTTSNNSSFHTGGGDWEYLTVTHTVEAVISSFIRLSLWVTTGNTTVYFDGAALVVGDSISNWPAPFTQCVGVYGATNQKLANWYFRDWSLGPALAPDRWTLTGSGATVYRTMANSPKVHTSAAGITRAGTDCYLKQAFDATDLAASLGKYVSAGSWAYATVASRGYVEIVVTLRDSTTTKTQTSTAHTGGSSYEWLETEAFYVPFDATAVEMRLSVKTGDTSVEFSGALMVIGSTVAQTPHSLTADAWAFANHNAGTAGLTVTLQKSSDNWATPTDVDETSPSDDRAVCRFFNSTSATAWRIKVAGGVGDQVAEFGEIALGEMFEMPEYDEGSIGVLDRKMVSDLSANRAGRPLGRSVSRETKSFDIVQRLMARSTATGDFADFWEHAGGTKGLPFFYSWNYGDYPTEALYAWLDDDPEFQAPHMPGALIEQIRFRCHALAEW